MTAESGRRTDLHVDLKPGFSQELDEVAGRKQVDLAFHQDLKRAVALRPGVSPLGPG